jgi:hypothetical protein
MDITTFDEIQAQSFLQLEGTSGVFKTPNSKFRVRFFSTYANNYEQNYSRLLNELKPMRERTSIDQIRNITQVLQRDLDDFRISEGLVPYLINRVNGISDQRHLAFFPSILGVIIPKNYLTQNIDNSSSIINKLHINYPAAHTDTLEKTRIVSYQAHDTEYVSWRIKQNISGNRISPLSLLEIDTTLSEIIVLDGQHRANAFRVATNTFFTNPDNRIYEPFYDKNAIFESRFETNLPVTLICFESTDTDAEINPDLISRKLFIDVNNNAKPISSSRKILLDDRDPSSIITNSFYSVLAERNGFDTSTETLSLIHLGFDTNHSIRQRRKDNVLNITNPELISIIFDWYFFGSRTYNAIAEYAVVRESLRFNMVVLEKLLPESRFSFFKTRNEEGNEIKIITGASEQTRVYEEFKSIHFDPIYIILNGIHFLSDHYRAVTEMTNRRNSSSWTITKKDVWDEIFVGGEGLYFSYEKLIQATDPLTNALKDKRDAIEEIEQEFKILRATLMNSSIDDCNAIFESFSTLAFQVALFMAYYDFSLYYARAEGSRIDDPSFQINCANKFVHRINSVNKDVWIKVFTVIRSNLWNGYTDPKKWPSYHKLILRLIQDPTDQEFFSTQDHFDLSPEARIFSLKFKGKVDSFLNQNLTRAQLETPPYSSAEFIRQYDESINTWKQSCFTEVQNLFRNELNIQPFRFNFELISQNIIEDILG